MFTNDREPTDKDLMGSIRAGGSQREKAWHFITHAWSGTAMGVAMRRTGCDEGQSKEAFSMACAGVDTRIRHSDGKDFLEEASLRTYLTKATVNAALAILQKPFRTEELPAGGEAANNEHEQWLHSADECIKTINTALDGIGARCKKILLLFNDGYSMEEIAKEMGFENADVARREKHKCQNRFKTYLLENPAVLRQLIENCYG